MEPEGDTQLTDADLFAIAQAQARRGGWRAVDKSHQDAGAAPGDYAPKQRAYLSIVLRGAATEAMFADRDGARLAAQDGRAEPASRLLLVTKDGRYAFVPATADAVREKAQLLIAAESRVTVVTKSKTVARSQRR